MGGRAGVIGDNRGDHTLRDVLTRLIGIGDIASTRAHIDELQLNLGGTLARHIERLGGTFGQVNDAAFMEWTTVIDAHDDGTTIL